MLCRQKKRPLESKTIRKILFMGGLQTFAIKHIAARKQPEHV
jgi:hypothetical protein